MNRMSSADRAGIIQLLCEGQSIRAITFLTGASKNTVSKLLVDAGKACMVYYDANVVNVAAMRIQVDEMMYYNFVRIHQKLRVTPAMAASVASRPWEVSDIVALVEVAEAQTAPKVRGPYKPRGVKISN